jgi:hypothetical protein
MFKSASYLMHNGGFTTFRELLNDISTFIVQDETGFPLKYYDRERWELKFCGNYIAPIKLFSWAYQKDLAEIYRKDSTKVQVKFPYGYGNISTVILARKK